jgi:acetolactate synthase I/II/III large subunit
VKGAIQTGSDVIVATLENLGTKHVFGMPGTQNVRLYESLRKSQIRTVVSTSELAGGFVANGYARSSGRVGVLTTIPGPGFAFAIPGIAEAFLDSAPLLWIVETPASRTGKKFAQQAIDQAAIARPITKRIFDVSELSILADAVTEAYRIATEGEPGPVLLHVNGMLLGADYEGDSPLVAATSSASASVSETNANLGAVEQIWGILSRARRPVIFAGQGSSGAAASLERLASLLKAPVVATRSARGVMAEDNPLALVFTFDSSAVGCCNELLDESDAILALGAKFTHNGTAGFRLRMPREKLIHIDSSPESLNANYLAQASLQMDIASFLETLLLVSEGSEPRDSGWGSDEIARFKRLGRAFDSPDSPEPILATSSNNARNFFGALRNAMPRESCLVTDSGQHQILTTRHAQILAPRGLLIPTDFQSMGFGIPAAIGAKLAMPDRCVVAVIGDGGLAMIGLELATAVREKVQLMIVVFNDGALGQIRAQQMGDYGRAFGTELGSIDIPLMAAALGCNYVALDKNDEADLKRAIAAPGVTIVDVPIRDSAAQRSRQVKAYVRKTGRELLPAQLRKWILRKMT